MGKLKDIEHITILRLEDIKEFDCTKQVAP